jgi:enamine deaminase RidA (YjgF/YER057c/UK114 family)
MTPVEIVARLELPPAPKAVGVYKPLIISDKLIFVSGHGPLKPDKTLITGKVGAELSVEQGKAAARQVGLAILATLNAQNLVGKIRRVIKIFGMVNATSDFTEHPTVINGCSELFADIWGEEFGVGARSAVGMASLPSNIAVEIEAVFELNPRPFSPVPRVE